MSDFHGPGAGEDWTVPGYAGTRELGAGAGGRVVIAVHGASGRSVAIKYLGEGLRSDDGFRRAFRTEAELLGSLDSPHVAGLYEYVEGPRGAAIVMELVNGVPLRALLKQEGPTGPEAALTVLKGSLLGLAAAHATGVVHRDYKPENVLVGQDGSSKLVDFGIATRSGGQVSGISGTPPYMAPEQWRGAPADAATDVYAATVTFFECLTGRRPYSGAGFAELAVAHTSAPIPLEDVPEQVRELVARGMAKDAADRPADALAFVGELERVAGQAYGPDWEQRGQRKLAALAALLPLLFPWPDGAPAGSTDLAVTMLPGRRPPAPQGTPPGRDIGSWLVSGGALLAGALIIAGTVLPGVWAAGEGEARAEATTMPSPRDTDGVPLDIGDPEPEAGRPESPAETEPETEPSGDPSPGETKEPDDEATGGGTDTGGATASAGTTGDTTTGGTTGGTATGGATGSGTTSGAADGGGSTSTGTTGDTTTGTTAGTDSGGTTTGDTTAGTDGGGTTTGDTTTGGTEEPPPATGVKAVRFTNASLVSCGAGCSAAYAEAQIYPDGAGPVTLSAQWYQASGPDDPGKPVGRPVTKTFEGGKAYTWQRQLNDVTTHTCRIWYRLVVTPVSPTPGKGNPVTIDAGCLH
ncbi:serine/threonine-protein kinase [Streptomyces aidingensis]|nr:serine/threonine-protein kinase [Streptomyces aidingensis]